tara:strand:+ start:3103 stop:4110 length:1008 start_codon:yes stop_codon:yes gene_type:complete
MQNNVDNDIKELWKAFCLTSLEVTQRGGIKSDKDVAKGGAEATGILESKARGQVVVMDQAVQRKLNAVVARARNYMKSMTVPWSTSRNNDYGGRVSNADYLLDASKISEYEAEMTRYRQEWERVLETELYSQWDRMRAEALTELNGRFQDYFIPVDELRKCYTWKVWIKPLNDISGIENDIRVSHPEQVMERMKADAKLEAERKISNAVNSVAETIMGEVAGIIEGIDGYVFNEGDSRAGNSLPKTKGWQKLQSAAERAEQWTKALENAELTQAASMTRDLVSKIEAIGGGSLADARKALSGEDDTMRKEVKKTLEDIAEVTRQSQVDALEDWLN